MKTIDRPAAAGLKVVDPDAIGGLEKLALRRLCQDAWHRQDAQQDYS